MLSLICYLVGIGCITIMIIDYIPLAKRWIERIHMGRYKDYYIWQKKIGKVALRWLNRTPKVKVTDNERLIIIDIIKKNYSKSTIQYWQQAALLLGVNAHMRRYPDEKVEKKIQKYINANFSSQGNWKEEPKHIDSAILAYALMSIKDDNTYKEALDTTWLMLQDHLGSDGTIKYRKEMQDYRYVDTIGFVCPFLIKYGVKYSKEECIELGIKQIQEYTQRGMFKEEHIPYHAYNSKLGHPLGICGWGRGLGWYAIGLMDTWIELPEQHIYKPVLKEYIQEFARVLVHLQKEDGSWGWNSTRKEARGDLSTVATLSWFLLNVYLEGNEAYKAPVDKAITYMMKNTRKNGVIDFSQGDTKDIGVYSMIFDKLPFTQGFALRVISLYLDKVNYAKLKGLKNENKKFNN